MLKEEADPATQTAPLSATPLHERPQERLERLGARALSDAELVAMLLRSGTPGENVLSVASRLVHDAGSLLALVDWAREDFEERNGVGPVKALQLVTVMEIARRIREQGKDAAPCFENPAQVYDFFADIIQGLEVEKCWVLCLNVRLRLVRCVELSSGTTQATLIEPSGIFRQAVRFHANSVMLVHNHPSGDPEPSRADYEATRRAVEAGKVLGILVRDHVILGNPANDRAGQGWFSFKTAGVL
jgi:DNA repair protein RadC